MLNLERVNQLVRESAEASFGKGGVSRVCSEPTVDSTGQEALHIMIVFPGKSIPKRVTGDAFLDNLTRISTLLQENGDDRFPILQYATEDELEHSDDTES